MGLVKNLLWALILPFTTGSSKTGNGWISFILFAQIVLCVVSSLVVIQFSYLPHMKFTIDDVRWTLCVLLILGLGAIVHKLFRLTKHVDEERRAERLQREKNTESQSADISVSCSNNQNEEEGTDTSICYPSIDKGVVYQIVAFFIIGLLAIINDLFDIGLDAECIDKKVPNYKQLISDVVYNCCLVLFNSLQVLSMCLVLVEKISIDGPFLAAICDNFSTIVIMIANCSVFLCSMINQEIKFSYALGSSNATDTVNSTCLLFDHSQNLHFLSKFKIILNPFDVLFSFLAIYFMYGTTESDYEKVSKDSPKNQTSENVDNNTYVNYDHSKDSSETSPLMNDNKRLRCIKCTCTVNKVVGWLLIIIAFLVACTLIIFFILLFFKEDSVKQLLIVKKYVHAPLLWFFQITAFCSLNKNYEFINPKPLESTEKLLLFISPFLFLYEIFKLLSASGLCKVDVLSSADIPQTTLGGEIVESVFFILADFWQTTLIIQANRTTQNPDIEGNKSFSNCCWALILMNITSFVLDILGTFRFDPLTIIEETCYGEQFHTMFRNILSPPIILYRVVCTGFFWKLK